MPGNRRLPQSSCWGAQSNPRSAKSQKSKGHQRIFPLWGLSSCYACNATALPKGLCLKHLEGEKNNYFLFKLWKDRCLNCQGTQSRQKRGPEWPETEDDSLNKGKFVCLFLPGQQDGSPFRNIYCSFTSWQSQRDTPRHTATTFPFSGSGTLIACDHPHNPAHQIHSKAVAFWFGFFFF